MHTLTNQAGDYRPSPGPVYRIRKDVLNALDPMRKMAALSAINRGAWLLVENGEI
jgi:hypothetical protein